VRRFVAQGAELPDLEEHLPVGADRNDLYRGFFAGCDWLDPRHVADRREQMEQFPAARVYTDMRPAAYLDWLVWWDKQQRGPSAQLFERLQRVRAWQVLLVAAVAAGLWQVVRLGSSRRRDVLGPAVALSIATTGLATMALEIVLLFAFQSFYGYVYQRIGLIIAVFMLGLVAGSGWMNRLLRGRPGGSVYRMVLIDLLLAGLAAGIPVALAGLGRVQHWWAAPAAVEIAVFGLVAVAGLLGGLAFPLAAALYLRADGGSARAAGDLDAADHGGACLGALGTGLLLVPVLGIGPACGVLAALKLGSAAWLALAGRLTGRT
jgi:spermidine synthase